MGRRYLDFFSGLYFNDINLLAPSILLSVSYLPLGALNRSPILRLTCKELLSILLVSVLHSYLPQGTVKGLAFNEHHSMVRVQIRFLALPLTVWLWESSNLLLPQLIYSLLELSLVDVEA